MKQEQDLLSVVPSGSEHRVHGRRTMSYPSITVDILSTRKIELHEWELRRFTDPYWRLYWPLSAGGIVEINGVATPLTPGYLYLIPPNTVFSSTMRKHFTKWYAHFKLGRLADRAAPGIYRFASSSEMKTIIAQLDESDPQVRFPWLTIAFVSQALRLLPESVWEQQRTDSRILKALDFMSAHLSIKLTADQVAKFAGLSVRNLNHLFQLELKQSPMRVLLEYRLDEACRLLRGEKASIEEIAELCGLVNRHYLSRMMRQYRNTSPAEYRNLQDWT